MRIVGYHTVGDMISNSDGEFTRDNYLYWLLTSKPETIRACYHLDYFVAHLCKLLKLTKEQGKELYDTTILPYGIYELHYVAGKFFNIQKRNSKMFQNFSDMSQYNDAWQLSTDDDPQVKADEARDIGTEVYEAFVEIGLKPTALTSPIRCYEKDVLSKMDLANDADLQSPIGEYAYNCLSGMMVEAYQIGHFEDCYDFDVISAFGFHTANLIDPRFGTWTHNKSYQAKAYYGYAKCKVLIESDFSPIIINNHTPIGEFEAWLPKNKIDFINDSGIGKAEVIQGVWFFPDKIVKPFESICYKLHEKKESFPKGIKKSVTKDILCFSDDTEVWSERGIINIKDVKIGDNVYSFNLDGNNVELKPVVNIYQYKYDGNIYHVKNDNFDYIVTPEHKFILKDRMKKHFDFYKPNQLLELGELSKYDFPQLSPITSNNKEEYVSLWDYIGQDTRIYVIPNKKNYSTFEKDNRFLKRKLIHGYFTTKETIGNNPEEFEKKYDCNLFIANNKNRSHHHKWKYKLTDMLQLMGWYIAEGSITNIRDKRSGRTCERFEISIVNSNLTPLLWLLNNMGIYYSFCTHKKQGITKKQIYSVKIVFTALYNYLQVNCGKGALNKKIPKWVFKLDSKQLYYLWTSLMEGDGVKYKYRTMPYYVTISPELANNMRRLCLHLGIKTRTVEETPEYRLGIHNVYRVYQYRPKHVSLLRSKDIKEETYNGYVYCIEVSGNHTLLAGRNGKFEFIGNSSMWGKRIAVDNNGDMGQLFCSPDGINVESGNQIEVAKFVLEHKDCELLDVVVDGVKLSPKSGSNLLLPSNNGGMGQWKLSSHAPTFILGSGASCVKGKETVNELSINYDWLMKQIQDNPDATSYSLFKTTPRTLGDSVQPDSNWNEVGELIKTERKINFHSDKREFLEYPETGKDLMKQFKSLPLDINQVLNKDIEFEDIEEDETEYPE